MQFPLLYKEGINVPVSKRGYRARPPCIKRERYLVLKEASTEQKAHGGDCVMKDLYLVITTEAQPILKESND